MNISFLNFRLSDDYLIIGNQNFKRLTEENVGDLSNIRDMDSFLLLNLKYPGISFVKQDSSSESEKNDDSSDSSSKDAKNAETPEARTEELLNKIRSAGWSYLPLYQIGYDPERSFQINFGETLLIFPYNTNSQSYCEFDSMVSKVLEYAEDLYSAAVERPVMENATAIIDCLETDKVQYYAPIACSCIKNIQLGYRHEIHLIDR